MRSRKATLPPVKVGSVSIPRYKLTDGRVMIAYPTATKKRVCRTFVDPAEAKAEAERIARELHNGGSEAAIFDSADRASYSQAKRDVAPFAVSVHTATGEWSEARKRIYNSRHSLAEVVAAGLKALTRTPHPVPDVVAELIEENRKKDLHGRYRDGLHSTLQRFAEAFPCDIREVKAAQIARYLDGVSELGVISGGLRKRNGTPIGTRRRDNVLEEIRYLFQFARLHGYLPDEITEPKKIPLIDEGGGEISFFTIAEMRLILEHVREEWMPFVALMVFNGFRTEELVKHRQANRRKDPLRWDDFDWEENEICVREATSKIDRKRIVPLHDITREWLAQFRKATGYVAPQKRTEKEFGKGSRLERAINATLRISPQLRAGPLQLELNGLASGTDEMLTSFAWRHNALRHSYGSYRASILKNVHQLAEEMGTSPEMIHRHYRNPRPASQARAWFSSLRPSTARTIIPFQAAVTA